ncbi:thioesterase family protein [Phocaeicola paurosaccharolyticus]|jgi:fluoroacetyl-CoA thioesterase|uniref:thioesterase family protein n=1 Tax=Phocaeicola paurosaccharolyticus TaxID=732242 RepID=UPI000557FAA4|nr:thioesterase family protein [Phocaeicola paurosaccharolyticus]
MEIGLTYTNELKVTEELTAAHVGSGDLPVLATPIMIALMENAAMYAVIDELDDESTTVGASVEATHLRPTPLDDIVKATATLEAVEGRKLTFKIVARDSKGIIGECTHVRYIVNIEKFMSKL